MKALKYLIGCTGLSLLTAAALAQQAGQQPSTTGTSGSSSSTQPGMQTASQTQQFYHAKHLLNQEAKDSQGQRLGKIEDILFNPQNGETFAAIGIGGLTSQRSALVPWQALNVTMSSRGKEEVTINTTKQTLESGPTITSDQWQQLENPTFVQSIYSHYNLQRPTAMGGTGAGAMGGTSTGTSTTDQNKSPTSKP